MSFPTNLEFKEDFVESEKIRINKFTLSERGRSFLLLFEAGVMPADRTVHGLINYIDNKAKCRHLKNWPVKDFAAGVYQSL